VAWCLRCRPRRHRGRSGPGSGSRPDFSPGRRRGARRRREASRRRVGPIRAGVGTVVARHLADAVPRLRPTERIEVRVATARDGPFDDAAGRRNRRTGAPLVGRTRPVDAFATRQLAIRASASRDSGARSPANGSATRCAAPAPDARLRGARLRDSNRSSGCSGPEPARSCPSTASRASAKIRASRSSGPRGAACAPRRRSRLRGSPSRLDPVARTARKGPVRGVAVGSGWPWPRCEIASRGAAAESRPRISIVRD
jgi:hypothetical protein